MKFSSGKCLKIPDEASMFSSESRNVEVPEMKRAECLGL